MEIKPKPTPPCARKDWINNVNKKAAFFPGNRNIYGLLKLLSKTDVFATPENSRKARGGPKFCKSAYM